MGQRTRRAHRLLGLATCVTLLATACSSQKSSSSEWVPQPDFQANAEPQPQLPGGGLAEPRPSVPGPGGGSVGPGKPGSSPNGSAAPNATDPSVVATKLDQPTGLVVLPDGTALVGERSTGRILRVQPQAGQPVALVQTLPVVSAGTDGGLLDLALSPTYSQDGLIYAYLTTATDNRVVHFALGSAPSPIVVGIPKGRTDNAGRIAFDATGSLLIGTGDAGDPALADSPSSLAGKVLRTTDIGRPAPGNPDPASTIFASGLRTVDGLCVDPSSGLRLAVSGRSTAAASRAGTQDEINVIKARQSYGWPTTGPSSTGPAATLPITAPGGQGCAVVGSQLVVVTSDGQSLATAALSQSGPDRTFTTMLKGKYGRLRTIVAGTDGALWLTTSNRDGHGKPSPADDRVVRISRAQVSGGWTM